MEILFLAITIGCLAFLAKVLTEYTRTAPAWKDKVEQAVHEAQQFEDQMQELIRAKENSAGESKEIDEEIKTMEKMRDELKTQIEATKKDMAKRGRIIMPRKSEEA
jgi:peptidoglycan hydrolase CwlO-like protein